MNSDFLKALRAGKVTIREAGGPGADAGRAVAVNAQS